MEQMVYAASHDLRSPLVNIHGFTKELQETLNEMEQALNEEDPEAMKKKLTSIIQGGIPDSLIYILSSTSKMDNLLSGLLRLSRLGRIELDIQELDMNTLLSDIVSTYEFQIKDKDVKISIGQLPPCKGDKDQIDQVFSNLLGNAVKYLNPKKQGITRITGEMIDGNPVYCVEDNGIGIAPEHQGNIFEIFHSLDLKTGGEGLGLTIVQRILDRHGGKIWLESEVGKGSKFYVSLPYMETQYLKGTNNE